MKKTQKMAFNRELSQFASYLELDVSANYIGITTAISANVGIGSVTPRQKLDVLGNAIVSGITTSTGGFVGDLTGTASNATQAEGLTGTPSVTVNTITSHINSSGIISGVTNFVATQGTMNITGDVTGTATTATNAEGLTGTPSITVKDITGTGNINIAGIVTANSFVGDGNHWCCIY